MDRDVLPMGSRVTHAPRIPFVLRGNDQQVTALVKEHDFFERGCFLFFDGTFARPACQCFADNAAVHWQERQRRFAARFLGVSCDPSPVGDDAPIRVATAGVAEFLVRAGRAQLGAFVGVAVTPDGVFLENERVQLVSGPERAIGRVARYEMAPTTRLFVRIYSRVFAPPAALIQT